MPVVAGTIADHYREMGDDDLVRLWDDYNSLTKEAQGALQAELLRRRVITEQDGNTKAEIYRSFLRAEEQQAQESRNFVSRAERFGVSVTISLAAAGLFLASLSHLPVPPGSPLALVQWVSENVVRFGIVIGVVCGLIPRKWLTTKKLVLIVSAVNVLHYAAIAIYLQRR